MGRGTMDGNRTTNWGKTVQRFTFDLSFDEDDDVEDEAPKEEATPEPAPPAPPPQPVFSAEDVAAARDEGLGAGMEEGMRKAQESIESRIGAALEAIQATLPDIAARQAEANERMLHDATAVAAALMRKLLPELARRQGVAEIEALAAGCLSNLSEVPKMTEIGRAHV